MDYKQILSKNRALHFMVCKNIHLGEIMKKTLLASRSTVREGCLFKQEPVATIGAEVYRKTYRTVSKRNARYIRPH